MVKKIKIIKLMTSMLSMMVFIFFAYGIFRYFGDLSFLIIECGIIVFVTLIFHIYFKRIIKSILFSSIVSYILFNILYFVYYDIDAGDWFWVGFFAMSFYAIIMIFLVNVSVAFLISIKKSTSNAVTVGNQE